MFDMRKITRTLHRGIPGMWKTVKPQTLRLVAVSLALGILALTPSAFAVQMVFFGEDQGLGEATPLAAFPNATAARNSFLSNLTGVGTESFEGFAQGTGAPLAINFPGAGTATLNGTGNVETVASGNTNGFGRYATDGTNYWDAGESFSITFDNPVAAFGFVGIDIGDFNGQVTVTTAGGLDQMFTINNTVLGNGGSVLFWGLIDTTAQFTSVTFGNTAAGVDFFGFDQMTIGSLQQVTPPAAVPEPGTLLLLVTGLSGLVAWRKLRKA